MVTYIETKLKALETINSAVITAAATNNHEQVKYLGECIIKAAKLMIETEDIQIAFESGDVEIMKKMFELK
jgi:hypothetical protein